MHKLQRNNEVFARSSYLKSLANIGIFSHFSFSFLPFLFTICRLRIRNGELSEVERSKAASCLMLANESIFTAPAKKGNNMQNTCIQAYQSLEYHLRQFNNHFARAIVTRITFAIYFIAIGKL